jgi:hypothetical protein
MLPRLISYLGPAGHLTFGLFTDCARRDVIIGDVLYCLLYIVVVG